MRKRPIKLSLRLNEEEHERLKKQAYMTGFSIEQYLRNLIDGHPMKPFPKNEMSEIKRQLAAIGNNINQIARKANTFDVATADDIKQVKEMMDKIWHIQRSMLLKQPLTRQ